jgi:hypothetical protein
MDGVIRMRDEVHDTLFISVFFECRFIIDHGNYYISVFIPCCSLYEYEISVLDSFLIHGVPIRSEEEILCIVSEEILGYWDMCRDILFGQHRCSTSDIPNERNTPSSIAMIGTCWIHPEGTLWTPIDPSFRLERVHENGYGAR